MNTPSEEQQHIIDSVKNGNNVIVHAVAGSGKSTTVLSLAKQMPEKRILQLTYNSSLRHEIKAKVAELKLSNIQIHTFHSLAVQYFSSDAHNDTELHRILVKQQPPQQPISQCDILVIDENQDSTFLYYRFVIYYLLHMGSRIQLICLGDEKQCIYEFKGADTRYLSYADKIWRNFIHLKSPKFVHCSLLMSYRITDQIGDFINKVMMGTEMMHTCRDGEPVLYIRNNRFNVENILIHNIKDLLTRCNPQDIFILCASLKSVFVRKLENILVLNNIPCFVPNFEVEKLDDRVINGKFVFSTFHSVKGRQRPYVFILGFDNNYFTHYARTLPTNECPNTLYVGASRPQQRLFVVEYEQFSNDRPLEFLQLSHKQMDNRSCSYIRFNGTPRSYFDYDSDLVELKAVLDKRFETPTKMVQFIQEHILDAISLEVEDIFKQADISGNYVIDLPSVQTTSNGFEDISDLNGIAIPSYYYAQKCSTNLLKNEINSLLLGLKPNEHQYLKDIIDKIPEKCDEISDFLFLANIFVSLKERLYFRLKQIENYDWIDDDILAECMARLENTLQIKDEQSLIFEHNFIHHSMEELHVAKIDPLLQTYFPGVYFRFSAIADVVTNTTLCEIKCTSNINIEHKLQLLIYAWLWYVLGLKSDKRFILLNVKTGEQFELEASFSKMTEIVVQILQSRYVELNTKSNKHFIKDCLHTMDVLTCQHIAGNFLTELTYEND